MLVQIFFHAHASIKYRSSQIKEIEVDGVVVTGHAAKTQAFTTYTELIGAVVDTRWDFSLQGIYGDQAPVDDSTLSATITIQEAESVLHGMDRNSAPGLDGFGASSILLLGTLSSQNWNNFCVPSTPMRQNWIG